MKQKHPEHDAQDRLMDGLLDVITTMMESSADAYERFKMLRKSIVDQRQEMADQKTFPRVHSWQYLSDAAAEQNVSVRTLQRRIKVGKLKARKDSVGRVLVQRDSSFDALLGEAIRRVAR